MARIVLSILVLGIAGCESVAISLVGAGAGMAMRYGIDGVAYRTITAPAPAVKEASLVALERMGLVLDATGSFESGEIIYARSHHRVIEIELEPVSAKATRMRIAAQTLAVLSRPTVTNVTVAAPQRQAFHLD